MRDKDYLELLSQKYPTIDDASVEIINLKAICKLPKGTEYFLSELMNIYIVFGLILCMRNIISIIFLTCVFCNFFERQKSWQYIYKKIGADPDNLNLLKFKYET